MGNKKTRVLLNHLHLAYINTELLGCFKQSEKVSNFLGWVKTEARQFYKIELSDKKSIEALSQATRQDGYEDIGEWIQARMRRRLAKRDSLVPVDKRTRSHTLERMVDAAERTRAAYVQRAFAWMRLGWEISATEALLKELLIYDPFIALLNPRIRNRRDRLIDSIQQLRKKLSLAPELTQPNGGPDIFYGELCELAAEKAKGFIKEIRDDGGDYARLHFPGNEAQQAWEQMSWEVIAMADFIRQLTYDPYFAEIVDKRVWDDFYYLIAQIDGLMRVLDAKFNSDGADYDYMFYCYPKEKEEAIKAAVLGFRKGLKEKEKVRAISSCALFSPTVPAAASISEKRNVMHAYSQLVYQVVSMVAFILRMDHMSNPGYLSKHVHRKMNGVELSASVIKERVRRQLAAERYMDCPVFKEKVLDEMFGGKAAGVVRHQTNELCNSILLESNQYCRKKHAFDRKYDAWTNIAWALTAAKHIAKSISENVEMRALLGEELAIEFDGLQSQINDVISRAHKEFMQSHGHTDGADDSPFFFSDLSIPRAKVNEYLLSITGQATEWSDKYFDLLSISSPSDEELDEPVTDILYLPPGPTDKGEERRLD